MASAPAPVPRLNTAEQMLARLGDKMLAVTRADVASLRGTGRHVQPHVTWALRQEVPGSSYARLSARAGEGTVTLSRTSAGETSLSFRSNNPHRTGHQGWTLLGYQHPPVAELVDAALEQFHEAQKVAEMTGKGLNVIEESIASFNGGPDL
jgi:hypothetical protein